jgi:hypothetical protein
MNDFIKEKKYLTLLSNQTKRRSYVLENANWLNCEVSEHEKVRIQKLRFTSFIRVQLKTYNKYIDLSSYITLGYFKLENDMVLSTMYNENDIVNYLAQKVLESKQRSKIVGL